MRKPKVLVTNDDGIDCGYLHALVNALCKRFDVFVVAPKDEQSWAGRSFSRRGHVAVAERKDLPWPAWAVDGTPSDAVNLALGSILSEPVDMVVSGINVGFNITLPLVMTSGTVAAALEGALWGHRAIAFSQAVNRKSFETVKAKNGHIEGEVASWRDQAAEHAAILAEDLMDTEPNNTVVHNVNFPAIVSTSTPLEKTQLGLVKLGGLFAPDGDGYEFAFPTEQTNVFCPDDSDVQCLGRGHVSHTVLDYRSLGRF
jgi:5'-nucleotidase